MEKPSRREFLAAAGTVLAAALIRGAEGAEVLVAPMRAAGASLIYYSRELCRGARLFTRPWKGVA